MLMLGRKVVFLLLVLIPVLLLILNFLMFQSLQELWVYLAEEQHFTDFNNSEKLVWHERGLKFGNWSDGPQMDGSRLFSTNIQASEV